MAKKFNFSGLDKQFKDSMATKEAYSSANGTSASKQFDMKAFGNVPFLKLKKDENYIIRFVPYEVDKNHPKVMEGKLEAGDYAYVLDYTLHRIGPNGTKVICPRGTFGHTCPVCDRFFGLRKDGASKEETDPFRASRRVMYNVVLGNDPSKLYVLDESHHLFEKELLAELAKGDDEGNQYSMADFCVGFTEGTKDSPLRAVKVMVSTDKVGKVEFNKYSFKVVKYNGDVDEDVVEEAVKLHNTLIELKPSELEDIMYGSSGEEEEDEDEYEEEEKLVIGKKPVSQWDEDDDVPAYKPSKKVEEEEEEEDEDDSPKCPHGHEFGGKTSGLEDECDDCPYFSECRAEKKRRKSLGR